MNQLIILLLLFACACGNPHAGTYSTEKVYVGTNGHYRVDTTFYMLKKGAYIYEGRKPQDDDSNPALEQAQRDLIFGD
jgi:hypothetical protein